MKKNNTRTQNPRGRKTVPQPITIGIDLGDKTSRWCALIDDEVREGTVATNRQAILALFGKLPRCRVAIEVGAHSRWVDRLLRDLGHEVYVANARQLKLITASSRKDDGWTRRRWRGWRGPIRSCCGRCGIVAMRRSRC